MATFEKRTASSPDDCIAYYDGSSWGWSNTWQGHHVGYYTDSYLRYGGAVRFTNVTIPQGAVITSAYLEFVAYGSKSGTVVRSRIQGHDVDNSGQIADWNDYKNRRGLDGGTDETTTACVDWDDIPAWTDGQAYQSPDISSVIQEIIDRPGWSSGNAITLFWDDHDDRTDHTGDNRRAGRTYDNSPTEAPLLHIEYAEPQTIQPVSTPSAFSAGIPKLTLTIQPVSTPSAFSAGTPKLTLTIKPVSTPSAFSAGIPKLNLTIKPVSAPSAFSAGTPTIIMGAIIIQPVSAPSAFSAGKPTLVYPQVLQPVSTPSAFSAGTPTVVLGGFIIQPASTPSAFSAGKPAIIKYVWHVILDARYLTVSPDTNRLLVIGRHDDGYEVFGSHSDSDEIALVGERLDFIPEPAIPTDSQAAEVAQAVLKKLRLTTNRGVILIPPNCGQELWDVIQVQDSPTAQQAQKYRVIGIRLEYHPRRARYAHTLILGSP